MVALHLVISAVFFVIGFLMRYGFAIGLAEFFYNNIPKLSEQKYNEICVRRFVGETSIKLGSFIFVIAMVGIFQPESFNIAMIIGWICFGIVAVSSVTFMDKFNIIKKLKDNTH